MKKNIFLYLLFFTVFFNAQEKETEFKFYYSYPDFKTESISTSNTYTIIENETDGILKISGFKYVDTDKKAKKENSSWAILYKNELYFNMTYAAYIYSFDYFAKVDIIGDKYLVIFLDEKKNKKAIGKNNPYGGSIVGALLNMRSKDSWSDKNGNSYKVLLINLENPQIIGKRDINFAYLVDTNKILELTNNDSEVIEKLKNNQYFIEDFTEFIDSENKLLNRKLKIN